MSACKHCGQQITVALVAGRPVATEPVGARGELLMMLVDHAGTVVCDGMVRGDIGDPVAMRAVHRRHGCGDGK